ncbi:MAG: type II toxin-antitoxin system VapC family toxin [Acidobacteria bacterium]|nr:type II toxin-antitoxin system VapC family toxin [Acidobacteriota bacterium]
MLNLDTHILIHALEGDLTPQERKLLTNDRWSISAIVLWEIAKLHQLGRIALDVDSADVARVLAPVYVWPLDLAVCRQIRRLDFKGDPADEIIASTSIVNNVPLVTRDRVIRRSKIVPLA